MSGTQSSPDTVDEVPAPRADPAEPGSPADPAEPPKGPAGPEVTAEILAAAARRARALVAGDAATLTELHHPGLLWTTFRGEVLDRDSYVEGNTSGRLVWLDQRLEDTTVVAAGDTAVLAAVVIDTVSRDGVEETHRLRLTQMWIRGPVGWTVIAAHAGPPVS